MIYQMYPWWYIKIALKSTFRFIKWWSVRNCRCETFRHSEMLFGIPPFLRLFSTILGTKASTTSEKAKALNKFFSSTFHWWKPDKCTGRNRCICWKVSSIVSWSHRGKWSPGPDVWHPVLLKSIADLISLPLSILFQKSLDEGILPPQWLKACVTAIHKKGEKGLPGNYRPISITSILCKIMESFARDQLVEHLVKNNLISKSQHGFVPLGNCITNLLTCLEGWTNILECNDSVDVIYTDFAKAFDSVPHQRLIKNLRSLGVTGKILTWIESFLSDRVQCVEVEGEHPSWKPVESGIPQGSVLGPILFVVLINDMPDEVKSMCQLFADDAKVYTSVNVRDKDAGDQLQKDLEALSKWSDKWQLPFNDLKCKILHIGNNNPCRRYTMKGKQPEYVNE